MGFLNSALGQLQDDIIAEWKEDPDTKTEDEPPKIKVASFSFERLHEIMLNNHSKMVALYDELEMIFGLVGRGSDADRRQLLSLEGGGEWSREYKTASGAMARTAFNLTGFVQPYYIMSRYLADNHDGLMDRLLVSCPQRLKVYWESLRSDMPRHIPSLLFSMLRQAHARQDDKKYTYTLTDAAHGSYGEFFNWLEDEMDKFNNDEDRQSILSKIEGKTARIAMSLTALDQTAD